MRWIAGLVGLALVPIAAGAAAALELYGTTAADPATPVLLDPANPGQPERRLPVLFVHGHNPDSANDTASAGPNYQQNFWSAFGTLPSFKLTLDHADNASLAIEPYYIRFQDQERSITEDARDIGAAIDLIVARHNPGFATANPTVGPPVQVVVIAYSKGTISTRQYLKSLTTPVQDSGGTALPAPRPSYRPVSEFIAVSPPNHAINIPLNPLSASFNSLSRRQLNNGYSGVGCVALSGTPAADDYIELLNGHSIHDTETAPFAAFASEAPGSRPPLVASSSLPSPPTAGTLYVTLYAQGNADLVGGDDASGDCQGRKVARNLSPDAVNMALAGIPSSGGTTSEGNVHANTVHTAVTICAALFTALHHRAPGASETCTTNADGVPVIPVPPRAAAMLALDISGSMLLPACAGCASRLDVLKDSVELFTRLWSVLGRPDDSLGATYFRTTVDQFAPSGAALPPIGDGSALIANVRSQTTIPANMTAMGAALQQAVEALEATPTAPGPRHVILFTDGMQNVNPMVLPNPAEPGHLHIANDSVHGSSNVSPANPPMRLNALGGVKIDTIGIGAGQAFLDLLADIAGETGGDTKATSAANDDLRQFFVEALINALRGFSPELVGYRRGVLGAAGASESFTVNAGARILAFKLSGRRGQSFDLRILKDGVDVTAAGRLIEGDFYRIYSYAFPGTVPASGGQWQMVIGGKAKGAYEAAALVDDGRLAYRARLGPLRALVDRPIELAVQILVAGRPVDGPVSVAGTLERPRIAAGNLLGPVKLYEDRQARGEPGQPLAERRLLALLGDSSRAAALAPSARADLVFADDGKGGFRASIGDVTTPGLYRATIRIKGEDRELGPFERTETAIAVVRFAEAVLAKSAVAVRALPGKGAVELTLKPRDRHGNLLGPGLPEEVRLGLEGARDALRADDLGDGRYRFAVPVAKGGDPGLALEVAGRPLFKGTLKALRAEAGG